MININNKSWDKLRVSDINKFLSSTDDESDESFFFELKSDDETPAKLAKEISAFSNTYGGYIFLGVNDDKTVGGCTKWTEKRTHTSIYDSITPVPNFDVKRFKTVGKVVLVIKVEEGAMPPYITNKGQVFQRVSSGSFPIINSEKLSQLYAKRADQLIRTRNKIELDEIRMDSTFPRNLCGYMDWDFSVVSSETTNFQKNFFTFDHEPIAEYLKSEVQDFSLSRFGYSVLISIGRISRSGGKDDESLVSAGIHNFIEIMCDGSVSSRIILSANTDGDLVNISQTLVCYKIYRDIYKMIFGDQLSRIFVYAQKYQQLKVIKQFTPYYEYHEEDERESRILGNYLDKHRDKYGDNLILTSSRIPKNDYSVIDRRWLSNSGFKFDTENIIEELFSSAFFNLGYIDQLLET